SPAFVPLAVVMPVGAIGLVRSIFTVWLLFPEALPTASAPEYTTPCVALSPLTVTVRGAAEVTAPAASTLVVAGPMPTPAASLPLTTKDTIALNQPAHDPALHVADITGAVRSDFGLCAGLATLVKKPAPWAIFVWTVYVYVPSAGGVSEYVSAAVVPTWTPLRSTR